MKWKGFQRQQSCRNLRCYACNNLQTLMKAKKSSLRIDVFSILLQRTKGYSPIVVSGIMYLFRFSNRYASLLTPANLSTVAYLPVQSICFFTHTGKLINSRIFAGPIDMLLYAHRQTYQQSHIFRSNRYCDVLLGNRQINTTQQ
jgi:hypothetical protein